MNVTPTRSILSIAAAVLVPAALAPSAHAHHSMSEYDRSVVTEFQGEVVQLSWTNPHVLLWVETPDENGKPVVWELEGSAVSAQRRRGVMGGEVNVGDQVRVAGWPSVVRPEHMQVTNVLLPDGVELLVGGAREPRWADSAVGGERNLVDPAKAAAATGEGIFRVWSQGTGAWYFTGRSDYELTESAAAAKAGWDDIEDNPIMQCVPPGMPGLMGNPYPMEFTQRDGHIELRFEEFDALRTIHMEDAGDPADMPFSNMGYSVGHWEGDTLVVRTTRINWDYFDRQGAPMTTDVVVDERFTVVEDGNRLNYLMTVTDPAILVRPFVWDAHFIWRRGEEVNLYDCTLEYP